MSNYTGVYNGKSLKHYRTKGSRNGYSKDPNYKPIGDIAKGPEFYARMATQQRQAMSGVNNSMEAYRRAQLANKAATSTASGPQAMARAEANKSYNQASYANAQAKAMQARNKAHGTAYGQMKAYGAQQKANAIKKQNAINAAKGAAHNPISPQQAAEQRRIAGGSGTMVKDPELARKRAEANAIQARIAGGGSGRTAQSEATAKMIKGSAMKKTPQQRQAEVMERRIKGGNYGVTARTSGINSGYDAQAAEKAKKNQRAEYAKLERRRKYENQASGVTANKAAAEARRIAGGSTGTSKSFADSKYGKMARNAYNAGKEAAKDAGALVKKGKKKVKKLLSKWF